MARSTLGVDKSDLNAFYVHMRTAVAYTTAQTTGTVMRTTPRGAPRRDPDASPRAGPHQPTITAWVSLDEAYLALHPYTP